MEDNEMNESDKTAAASLTHIADVAGVAEGNPLMRPGPLSSLPAMPTKDSLIAEAQVNMAILLESLNQHNDDRSTFFPIKIFSPSII